MILSYQPELIFDFDDLISSARSDRSKIYFQNQYEIFKLKKLIGYWKYASTYEAKETGDDFNNILPNPKDYIDTSWDICERNKIINYLENGKRLAMYLGLSPCRICNGYFGSKDLTDNVYIWPEGFVHYLKEHGVKPPQEFIEHVLSEV